MPHINIIRPPKVSVDARKNFWKQIGMIIIGTTISLLLTISAAALMERHQRAKDRKLSAMMVMSNIEVFARLADGYAEYMASADSIATWLLSKPLEELELMPEEELNSLIDQATVTPFLSHDKSAENIFTNNIETWKNMGNVVFINIVGQCFSTMNQVEEYWNKQATDLNGAILDIKDHPDQYDGSSIPMKIIRNDKVRRAIKGIHYWRAWLSHAAATMRFENRHNMEAIGISEEKVMAYTNDLELGTTNADFAPDFDEFYNGPISPDNLSTMRTLDARLDSLKGR